MQMLSPLTGVHGFVSNLVHPGDVLCVVGIERNAGTYSDFDCATFDLQGLSYIGQTSISIGTAMSTTSIDSGSPNRQ